MDRNKTKAQAKNKQRSLVAAVLAIILLLASTLAWQSFGQEARNESHGTSQAVGARLHDDFDGTNKDVYVENFMTPEEGGNSVVARIRIDEYMETGLYAGELDNQSRIIEILRGDLAKTGVSNVTFDNEDSWDTYVLFKDSEFVEIEPGNSIREYRDLYFGGTKAFMPTFNKNSEDLEAEINGTIYGLDGNIDTENYDDYSVFVLAQEFEDIDNRIYYTMEDDVLYYLPEDEEIPNYFDEAGEPYEIKDNGDGTYYVIDVTHTAKETVSAKLPTSLEGQSSEIVSMAQWEELESSEQVGNFWVYDTDGWAYWANLLPAGEATSLLLTGINKLKHPEETAYYYAINIVSQIASIDDVGNQNATSTQEKGMYANITENGKSLLSRLGAK